MPSKVKKADKPKPTIKSGATSKTARASAHNTQRTVRETVESVAVAFVLAFLFRTFEAEAFVIPTGSMAPTLQGRHKDLVCPECKFRYRVSASGEEDDNVQKWRATVNDPASSPDQRKKAQDAIRDRDVVSATCPNCRYTLEVDRETSSEFPSYNGDRILVAKFPYDFADPERWDVVVFRFPGNSAMNYIKRMIGRPHETIRIRHGDIYVKPGGEAASATSSMADSKDFDIARKPPDKVRAMSQTVYDNDYIVDEMTEAGWPLRWQPWQAGEGAAAEGWKSPDGGRSYAIGGAPKDADAWVRYQHFIPFGWDWSDIKDKGNTVHPPRPRLISDFYAYNDGEPRSVALRDPPPMNWVGDLILEATVNAQSSQGTVLLDLVRAGRHGRCEIDLASGEARLSMDGQSDFQPKAKTAVQGTGRHRLVFSNVDRQLLLWVDGKVVQFDAETAYAAVGDDIPNIDDLAPAGIGSRGAELEVEHILLRRDVYYIATRERYSFISDYEPDAHATEHELIDYFAEPEKWVGNSKFAQRREVTFPLEADQFFVLGDNSPASKDSRLWSQETRSWSAATRSWSGDHLEFYVSRELLIGKALFIYWPHSFDRLPFRIPFTNVEIPFPYFPNFQDMGFVR